MEKKYRRNFPALLAVSVLFVHCYAVLTEAAIECKFEHGDYCKCTLTNGYVLDMTSLKNISEFLNPAYPYNWSPCGDVINYTGTACAAGTAACYNEDGTHYSMGNLSSVSAVIDETGLVPGSVNITYTGGTDGRRVILRTSCTQEFPGCLSFEMEDPPLTYNFWLANSAVCLKGTDDGSQEGRRSVRVV
eukprot:scpid96843/ scgid34276/ 